MNLKPILIFAVFAIFVQTSIVCAQDIQTGSFKITSTSEVILGKEMASDFDRQLDIDEEIKWQVQKELRRFTYALPVKVTVM